MSRIRFNQTLDTIKHPYDVILVGEDHDNLWHKSYLTASVPYLNAKGYRSVFIEEKPSTEEHLNATDGRISRLASSDLLQKGDPKSLAVMALFRQSKNLGMNVVLADSPHRVEDEAEEELHTEMDTDVQEATDRFNYKKEQLHVHNSPLFIMEKNNDEYNKAVAYASFGDDAFNRLQGKLNLSDDLKRVAQVEGKYTQELANNKFLGLLTGTQYDIRNDHIAQEIAAKRDGKKVAILGERHVDIPANSRDLKSVGTILNDTYGIKALNVTFTDAQQINQVKEYLDKLDLKPGDVTVDEIYSSATADEAMPTATAAYHYALSGQEIVEGAHMLNDQNAIVVTPIQNDAHAASHVRDTTALLYKLKP